MWRIILPSCLSLKASQGLVFIGNKLHHIYLGKECKPTVPYSWEDDVDLDTICATFGRNF